MRTLCALALGAALLATAPKGLAITQATWQCGSISNSGPTDGGTVLVDHQDSFGDDFQGSHDEQYQAQIVFSEGSVVKPSADVMVEASYVGPSEPGNTDLGTSAHVEYYGMVAAAPGAPAGELIPLEVHVMGYAKIIPANWYGDVSAHASSAFYCAAAQISLTGAADVSDADVQGSTETDNEYDKWYSVRVPAGVPFEGVVDTQARVQLDWSFGMTSGSVEAFADPVVQIDPNYVNQYYTLQFSDNIPTSVPEPATLLLLTGALAVLVSRRVPWLRFFAATFLV